MCQLQHNAHLPRQHMDASPRCGKDHSRAAAALRCSHAPHFPQCAAQTGAGNIDAKMGPGPAVGSAGGFRDPATAAMTGKPVVGPGFGPGAVNATPGEISAWSAEV